MNPMRWWMLAMVLGLGCGPAAWAQIDPVKRELIQAGYNQPVEGRGPLAVYAFYYLNKPLTNHNTNLTLRLAVAPVFVDTELGIRHIFGRKADLGLGFSGGGFGESYYEIRQGRYLKEESFSGHGGEVSASLYYLFNPGGMIPLYAVLRGAAHFSAYNADGDTAPAFALPADHFSFRTRAGLRWGGREPVIMPELAMEVSGWYEGELRTAEGAYGLAGDRRLRGDTHLVWGRALLTYTFPKHKHQFELSVTGGVGWETDRFSAFRLGGNLPLSAEFPLPLPGYFFHELSARSFVLMGGSYNVPLSASQRWRVGVMATTSYADYLPGLEQPGQWNSALAASIAFRSPSDSWQWALAYGYGFDAIRSHGRGAQSLMFLLQFDLGRTRQRFYDPSHNLDRSRGLQSILRNIFR